MTQEVIDIGVIANDGQATHYVLPLIKSIIILQNYTTVAQ